MRRGRMIHAVLFSLVVLMSIVFLSSEFVIKWTPDTQLTFDDSFDAYPSVVQLKDGRVWVVWQSNRVYNPHQSWKIFYKFFNGSDWSEDKLLVMSETWQGGRYHSWQWHDLTPSIVETTDGKIWIFWASNRTVNYDVFYRFSSDGGLTWSTETQLTTHLGPDKLPSITQTHNGKIWVAWQSERGEEFDVFYKTTSDKGVTWSNDTALTTETDVDTDPIILQTAGGRIWVIYASRQPVQNSQDELYYKVSEDGVLWSDRVQLTKDNYDDMYPSITQSNDRRLWIVWASDRMLQPEIFYKTSFALQGDANENGAVDVYDLNIVSKAYRTQKGDPDYDPAAEINNDDRIDLWDLTLVAKNYGKVL